MGSRKNPGRRPLRAWQLTAAVGVTGALALAGCSSGGSTSSSSGGGATASATGAATGTISWSASPITTSGTDVRQALIQAFEKQNPKIKVNLISAPTNTDTNRATLATQSSGGPAPPDVLLRDANRPAQCAAHPLPVPLPDYQP